MNLHGLVSGAIGVVNPFETVAVSYSTGYDLEGDGTQTPSYETIPREAQVQALTFKDLLQVNAMNIQGVRRRMYFYGEVDGIVRMLNKGGDTITRGDGTVWLVAYVLEQWPDWCAVCVTQQNGS